MRVYNATIPAYAHHMKLSLAIKHAVGTRAACVTERIT